MTSRDPRAWMWAEACDLLDRADRLSRHFFRLESSAGRRPVWQPPADLFETGCELQIHVALPGVAPDDLQVVIDQDAHRAAVIVVGERRLPAHSRGAAVHRIEIPYGRFERRIDLPAGHFELGRRELAHGCLVLTLRKL